MMTKELVCSLLEYQDGKLFWKTAGYGKTKGKEAGCVCKNGYRYVRINYKLHLTHRLVYLMFNEGVPSYVDHINGNPLDNRIENLREATCSQNLYNSKISSRNTSGIKGISWYKAYEKWEVYVDISGKRKHCGYYTTIEEAKKVATIKRQQLHKEFARHE